MLKLGVLGGTFNPIHVGHLIVAQCVLEELSLDQIVFLPTGNPPHKSSNIIENGLHRINMIKEAIKHNEKFSVCDMEVKRKGITYTYDTLCEMHSKYKDVEINFIVGYDTLLDMKNWHKPHEVVKMAKFIVVNRDSSNKEIYEYKNSFVKEYGGKILVINIPNIGISSSKIREAIKEGRNPVYMTTEPVYKYIIKNNLYKR